MNIKKAVIPTMLLATLFGCSIEPTTELNWNTTDSTTEITNPHVEDVSTTSLVKSAVWLNQMPIIGEKSDPLLHASLILESDNPIPSDLVVESLYFRQLDSQWVIGGDDVEIYVENENVWQLKVRYPIDVNPEEKIDVAVELLSQNNVYWLSNTSVKVDVTY
jgi:hypothetical protein